MCATGNPGHWEGFGQSTLIFSAQEILNGSWDDVVSGSTEGSRRWPPSHTRADQQELFFDLPRKWFLAANIYSQIGVRTATADVPALPWRSALGATPADVLSAASRGGPLRYAKGYPFGFLGVTLMISLGLPLRYLGDNPIGHARCYPEGTPGVLPRACRRYSPQGVPGRLRAVR